MAEGLVEQIEPMIEIPPKENDTLKKASNDGSQTCETEKCAPSDTDMALTSRNDALTSKLGNGDCFHNPDNLVQFVVSGKISMQLLKQMHIAKEIVIFYEYSNKILLIFYVILLQD